MPTSLKIIIYFRVGFLLHLITALEILIAGFLFTSSWFIDWLGDIHFVPRIILTAIVISLPFFAQLDARSRYQNYKMLMDRFYFYGFQLRIIKPFAHSRCQRDAVRVAASNLGYLSSCNDYFKKLGYKWYHLFPDFLIKNPLYLFNKNFWQTTFLVKHYKSKVNYKTICLKKIEVGQSTDNLVIEA